MHKRTIKMLLVAMTFGLANLTLMRLGPFGHLELRSVSSPDGRYRLALTGRPLLLQQAFGTYDLRDVTLRVSDREGHGIAEVAVPSLEPDRLDEAEWEDDAGVLLLPRRSRRVPTSSVRMSLISARRPPAGNPNPGSAE